MKKITKKETLWLAGLLDGDGFFTVYNKCPYVGISLVDEDLVSRVSDIFERDYHKVKVKDTHTPQFKVRVGGKDAKFLMDVLYPFLSQRRQSKINAIKEKCKGGWAAGSAPGDMDINEEEEFHWLAGLLDAEGSFLKGFASSINTPTISIQMTDFDIISKVSKIFKTSIQSYQRNGLNKGGEPFKMVYLCLLRGSRAVDLMRRIKCLMCKRRASQIEVAVSSYNPYARAQYLDRINKNKKIKPQHVAEIKEKISKGFSLRKIAKEYGVSHSTIGLALKEKD